MSRVLGTGDHNVAALDVPAQDDLGIALAVFLCQLREQRLLPQRLVAVSQGIPRLDNDAFLIQKFLQFLFLRIGMHFCLKNCGFYFADVQDLLNLLFVEVGQANGLHLTLLVGFLHLPVAGHIIARGLVDQQEVNIVGVQALERLFHRVRLLIKARPQLGFQENLLPGNTGFLHRSADRLLIYIGVGGVDQPVAALKGREHRCFRLIRAEHKGADTGHRHFYSVV